MKIFFLITILTLFVFSCTPDDEDIKESKGKLGEECYSNLTCDAGLLCNNNICEEIPTCNPICNEWEHCDNGSCKLSNDRCIDNNDCTDNKICNNNHNCVVDSSICNPICNEWEYCDNGSCKLSDDRCIDNDDCSDNKICNNHNCIVEIIEENPNQLIRDRHFQRGFIVVNRSNQEIGSIDSIFSNETKIWQFVFGSSQSNYNSLQPYQLLPSGAMLLEDDYSRMIIASRDMGEADLTLGVWGLEQYGGVYYVPGVGQEWVYHLAQQQISYPGNYDIGSPNISSLAKLDFSVFAQLLRAERNQRSGYNSNYHAAQYLIYFTIQNQNPNSVGLGDYLWFGVTIYDDRWEILGLNVQQDRGGTERLIYNLGNEPFISEGFIAGEPGKLFEKDILPAVRDALTRAWSNGFLTGSNNLSDYRVGGMNIGWEVPGLNNVEMKVKDLSLIYQKKMDIPVIFNFNNNGDREGWSGVNITDPNGPLNGYWIFNVGAQTPMLTSPELTIEAATHTNIKIVIANDHNPAETSILKIYWDRFGDRGFREGWSKSIAINNGGGFQTINLDMSNTPGWSGEIHQLRVDPILSGNGNGVGFDSITIE